MPGQPIIAWTIRISLVLYVATLSCLLATNGRGRNESMVRWIWTAAFVFFITHLIAAFHYFHHWSHQHAVEDTARQTEQLIGWAFGHGIYFSYGFAVLWFADVAWSWCSARTYRQRGRALNFAIHGYLFFIIFNGAIVFEAGITRWAGIAVCTALIAVIARQWHCRNRHAAANGG